MPIPRDYRDRSPPVRRSDYGHPDDWPARDDWTRPPYGRPGDREWGRLSPRDRPPWADWNRRSPPPRDEWGRPLYPRDYRERSPVDRWRDWSSPPRGFRDRELPPEELDRLGQPPFPPRDEFYRRWHRDDWPRDLPERERDLYRDRERRSPLREWDRRSAEYERERGLYRTY